MQTESNVSLLTNCRVQLIFCKDIFFTPNNQPFGTKRMIEARLTYHRSCQEQTRATLLYKLKPLPLQAPKDVKGEAKNYQKKCYKTHCVRTHILDLHHFFAFLHRKAVSFYCRKSQTNYLCIVKTRQHKNRKKIGF